jgi:hypothetical protein
MLNGKTVGQFTMGLHNLPATHERIVVLIKSVMCNGLFTSSICIHDSENSTIHVSLKKNKKLSLFLGAK